MDKSICELVKESDKLQFLLHNQLPKPGRMVHSWFFTSWTYLDHCKNIYTVQVQVATTSNTNKAITLTINLIDSPSSQFISIMHAFKCPTFLPLVNAWIKNRYMAQIMIQDWSNKTVRWNRLGYLETPSADAALSLMGTDQRLRKNICNNDLLTTSNTPQLMTYFFSRQGTGESRGKVSKFIPFTLVENYWDLKPWTSCAHSQNLLHNYGSKPTGDTYTRVCRVNTCMPESGNPVESIVRVSKRAVHEHEIRLIDSRTGMHLQTFTWPFQAVAQTINRLQDIFG